MSLTSLKDVDREVLKDVDDDKLLKICSVDRKTWNEVCDDTFLKRRLMSKYPGIEQYKREDESWKRFFLTAIYYISKMKEDYQFTYTSGNFYNLHKILELDKGNINDLLLSAARFGSLDLARHALEKGSNIHTLRDYALRLAAENGDLEMVKFLVDKGANIHAEDDEALDFAAQYGNLEMVKYLVEHGADVHAQDDSALAWAIEEGYKDVEEYLLKHGAIRRV